MPESSGFICLEVCASRDIPDHWESDLVSWVVRTVNRVRESYYPRVNQSQKTQEIDGPDGHVLRGCLA